MIEREYEDLMQEVLEGDATPAQIERLEGWLSRSEAGRARWKELEGMFQVLRRVPDVEPPGDLKEGVLRALRTRPGSERAGAARPWNRGSHFRPAFIFAAGLAAGVIGYGAVSRLPSWPPGDASVMGTMMPSRTTPPAAEAVRRSWSAGQSLVEAISWQTSDSRLAVFQVREGEARIEIAYDPTQLSLVGIGQTHARTSLVQAEPGKLVVSGNNRSEFTVEWRRIAADSAAPRITIQSGTASAQGELPAGGPPPTGR
jgi:hypothetical protein